MDMRKVIDNLIKEDPYKVLLYETDICERQNKLEIDYKRNYLDICWNLWNILETEL